MPTPGKRFKTSYILAMYIKQSNSKTLNSKILSITVNNENTTKCAQNVHCEPQKQREGDATD